MPEARSMLVQLALAALKHRTMIAEYGAGCGSFDFTEAIDKAIGVTRPPTLGEILSKLDRAWAEILAEET